VKFGVRVRDHASGSSLRSLMCVLHHIAVSLARSGARHHVGLRNIGATHLSPGDKAAMTQVT
jgi:hypothetical protein